MTSACASQAGQALAVKLEIALTIAQIKESVKKESASAKMDLQERIVLSLLVPKSAPTMENV